MGKKTKIGKQRKDKFYKLAKETGYRSRAAFKLVQLNRKFDFLQKCQVVVDLCAAPGGWLQVAREYTPMASLIIGVDLVSMKPINNVITLQNDITTDSCRQAIKRELKTWDVDCVLHDGAPNVGKNWIHDAFAQAQLTLSALRLATETLRKGGWFVTKVFRSKDYTALLNTFKELFNKVHATKPQASRNESAEIFVVCQGFKKPGKINPQLLDIKHVFKETHLDPVKPKLNVIHPEKKKKKRAEGYEEGDYSVYHKLDASEFVRSDNYLELLGKTNAIVMDEKELEEQPQTTQEIKECMGDIQILGRKELRDILNWRKKMREFLLAKKVEEDREAEPLDLEESMDSGQVDNDEKEEEEMNLAILEAQADEKSKAKKLKKKALKEKKQTREKINLKMVIPGDQPDNPSRDEELFDLVRLQRAKERAKDKEEKGSEIRLSSDDENDDSDSEDDSEDEMLDEEEFGNEDLEIPEDELTEERENSESATQRRTQQWFQQDTFEGLVTEEDEDAEIERMMEIARKRRGNQAENKEKGMGQDENLEEFVANDRASAFVADKTRDKSLIDDDDDVSDFEFEEAAESSSSSGGKRKLGDAKEMQANSGLTKKQKRMKLDAEGLALGTILTHSSKAKRDIIEFGYNRFTNNDTNLPEWFVEDEKKHYRKPLPVSQDLVDEYKARLTEMNSKTIKKVAEAKARKKKRAVRKMERARKKAENVIENPELTEKEKSSEMRRIYKKAGTGKERKKVTLVPAKKGMGKRVGRPGGVKGKFKVVDARMKKDMMKQKIREGKNKKGKGRKKKPEHVRKSGKRNR